MTLWCLLWRTLTWKDLSRLSAETLPATVSATCSRSLRICQHRDRSSSTRHCSSLLSIVQVQRELCVSSCADMFWWLWLVVIVFGVCCWRSVVDWRIRRSWVALYKGYCFIVGVTVCLRTGCSWWISSATAGLARARPSRACLSLSLGRSLGALGGPGTETACWISSKLNNHGGKSYWTNVTRWIYYFSSWANQVQGKGCPEKRTIIDLLWLILVTPRYF